MVGHGGSSAGSYLADPASPIPFHCASIVATSTVGVNKKQNSTRTVLFHQVIHDNGELDVPTRDVDNTGNEKDEAEEDKLGIIEQIVKLLEDCEDGECQQTYLRTVRWEPLSIFSLICSSLLDFLCFNLK